MSAEPQKNATDCMATGLRMDRNLRVDCAFRGLYHDRQTGSYLTSWRLQFAVRCAMCRLGGDHRGSASCASWNDFRTRAHIRFTSVRFSRFRPFSVEGSGQPCSEKSTSSVNNCSLGNCWINLTPWPIADSTQHGRKPQFMTKLSRPAYAASSAS